MEVPLQFRIFLTGYQNISLIGDPQYPAREGIDPTKIEQGQPNREGQLTSGGFIQGTKLFGNISDNEDEYIGRSELTDDDQSLEEIDESGISGDTPNALPDEARDQAKASGADIDNPGTMGDLGLNDYGNSGKTTNPSDPDPAFGMSTAPAAV
jgi:hypothetical protein